jgi:hypothetical protein
MQTPESPGPDMDFDDLKYSLDSGNTFADTAGFMLHYSE